MCSIYKNFNAFFLEHNKSIKTQKNAFGLAQGLTRFKDARMKRLQLSMFDWWFNYSLLRILSTSTATSTPINLESCLL